MPTENTVDCSKGEKGAGAKSERTIQQSDLPPAAPDPTDTDKLNVLAKQAGFATAVELKAALAK